MEIDMLADLPSRGNLVFGATIRRPPSLYICTHDTQPPENQVIKTPNDSSDIINIYTKRPDISRATEAKGKRPVPPAADAAWNRPQKKLHNSDGAGPSNIAPPPAPVPPTAPERQTVYTVEQLKAKTNKDLIGIVKSRGLAVSGRKEELIRRILDFQRRQKRSGV